MKATLENILCIIHRDGGHYIDKHGIQKAFDEALEIHYRQRNAEEHQLIKFTNRNYTKCAEEIMISLSNRSGIDLYQYDSNITADIQQSIVDIISAHFA
jgi:hypothetical protein